MDTLWGRNWAIIIASGVLLLLLGGCRSAGPVALANVSASPTAGSIAPQPTATPTLSASEAVVPATATAPPIATAEPTVPPEPVMLDVSGPYEMAEEHCGMLLPVAYGSAPDAPAPSQFEIPPLDLLPEEIRPAITHMLQYPSSFSLVAYEVGRESEGIYLNAGVPRPLASVVKVIHLVAYAEAVQDGTLDPQTIVPLSEIERYYLPGSDLRAHDFALNALSEDERIFGEPPAILLEDVPRMMMEYSSNAATDYLHMLLGQERIEQTAINLGLTQQSAPCPFLGQFLLMGRNGDGVNLVQELMADPRRYSREVMELTVQYSNEPLFREQSNIWRNRDERPTIEAQSLFSEHLNAHGTAAQYANLMAQIATNNMGPWEQSVRIRRYLEWPTHFEANQEKLAWLGYKGGSLPGVLSVVYYAQPWDRTQPVVVALFFHDLPREVYRDWRRSLPHDELARWLLRERDAIPMLSALLQGTGISSQP
jgi:hypothetical protein